MTTRRFLWSCLVLFLAPQVADAVMASAAIDVNGGQFTLLASQASFGSYPATGVENNKGYPLVFPPSNNALLCQDVEKVEQEFSLDGIMLVPRGSCTFQQKALQAQRMGAKGIIIHETLSSRYRLNETKTSGSSSPTAGDIIYPELYNDFDCNEGRAAIDKKDISFDVLPYDKKNDAVLYGPNSEAVKQQVSPNSCASQAFLLTGNTTDDNSKLEACCAWDLLVWLYSDPKLVNQTIDIPAVFISMNDAEKLTDAVMEVTLYMRPRPKQNLSMVLIWALGVLVAAVAAYMSADEYNSYLKRLTKAIEDATEDDGIVHVRPDQLVATSEGGARSRSRSPQQREGTSASGLELQSGNSESEAPSQAPPPQRALSDESLELNAGHALGFIIMASSGLMILFVFKIYAVVKVMYAFGCSGAVAQIIFHPLYWNLARNCLSRPPKPLFTSEEFGPITWLDLSAAASGYGLGLAWLAVAFFTTHPERLAFFWITQDIMGACMCILFLSIIKLNSLRVASVLLLVAFFYDIFFVFITPLIFKGESVMITVATSGGPPKADPLWCEKYPSDKNCQGGDPLPMLLTIPRFFDYQGGASLLGLGDIVLPGLLLSFAARIDAAKNLIGAAGGGGGVRGMRSTSPCFTGGQQTNSFCSRCCSGGYFGPMVVAYAVGLLMANVAVYVMSMGQPALLYLVPCCLGTISFMAWHRKELNELWHGPKVVRSADCIIYGEDNGEGGEVQLPSSETENGEVPLLV